MPNKLKELRLERKLSLRDLAEKVNISYSALSLAENGKRNLTDNDIQTFCNFYGVSSDYLLGLTDERTSSTTSTNDVTLAFYNQHGIVTEEQKKEVEAFIEFVKSKK